MQKHLEKGKSMQKIEVMDIKFGYSCNNDCIHCVIAGKREALKEKNLPLDRTTSEVKKHLQDAKMLGAKVVVFTGGEVTIRPDFFQLLKFAKNLGLGISLQTNGRMFSDKKFTKKTLQIAPDMHFEIALHATKANIHDKITRVKGSFEQTLNGMKNLLSEGAKSLSIKVVISRLNMNDLPNIIKFAKKLSISSVDIAFPHGMGNALKYWFQIVPTYSELKESIRRTILIAKKLGIEVRFETIPFCFLKGYEYTSLDLVYLKQHIEEKLTRLRQLNEPEIKWDSKRTGIKTKFTACKKCKYFYICEGVWSEYAQFYGSEEFRPVPGKQIKSVKEIEDLLTKAGLLKVD
jgi:MoaA/NifB/PqqE/SkfB family radical SAM enzyme